MRVLLIRQSFQYVYTLFPRNKKSRELRPPDGLMYIAAQLEHSGHEVGIIDNEVEQLTVEEIARRIKKGGFKMIGLGATTPEFPYTIEFASSIKELSDVQVVFGGPHVTALPEESLRENPAIDFIIREEGELCLAALAGALSNGSELDSIRGLSYRDNGKINHNPDGELSNDIDEFPLPARHLVPYREYAFPFPSEGLRPVSTMLISRGCPHNCKFCFPMHGRNVRTRKPELVVREMEEVVSRYGINHFIFHDESLGSDKKSFAKFCDLIKESGLKTQWACFTRADYIDEEFARNLARAGCVKVSMGIESGDPAILNSMAKKNTWKTCYEATRALEKHGIETRGSFIIGLPYESHESVRKTIHMAKSLRLKQIGCNISTPYPGTELYRMSQNKEGIELLINDWNSFKRWGNAVIQTPELTREEIIEYQVKLLTEFYARPTIFWYYFKQFIKGNRNFYYYRPMIFALREKLKRLTFRSAKVAVKRTGAESIFPPKNLDVLLIQPPLTHHERYGRRYYGGDFVPPIGLAYLASSLRDKERTVRIIDAEALGWNLDRTLEEVVKLKPSYVGITAVTISIARAQKLAGAIKERLPDTVILIGGHHISALPEETLRQGSGIDFAVVGEGELTTAALLDAIDKNTKKNTKRSAQDGNGGDYRNIDGIAFIDEAGEFVLTSPRSPISNLDDLPTPAWDLLPDIAKTYRASIMGYRRLPAASVVFSRGCAGKCTFCSNSVFGRNCRVHSAQYAFDTLVELNQRYGIREVEIRDENFLLHSNVVFEFCRLIREKELDITWSCNARVDTVTPELLKEIRSAGCWQVAYGIESGSQEILDFEKKKIDLEQVERAVAMTEKAGLDARGFFMIGHPMETEKTLKETTEFLKKLRLHCFHVTFFTPLPGAPIYDEIDKYGKFDRNFEGLTYWHKVFIPNGVSRELMDYYERKMYSSFYLRPRILLHYLSRVYEPAYWGKLFKASYTLLKIVMGHDRK